MAVGLRIFNNGGISQISDMHRNLVLVGKGAVNIAHAGADGYGQIVDFSYDGPCLFAASAPSGATAIVFEKNGTAYKFAVLFGNNQETATWYAFSYPKNIPSNSGLRVFNASGELAYDSQQKPLRLSHYSSFWVPGTPPIQGNLHNIPEWPSAPDSIYIPQQRSNRTYASLGIKMIAYRKVGKKWMSPPGAWLLGWAMFYYLPVAHPNGIWLQARRVLFAAKANEWPLGTFPHGGLSIYEPPKDSNGVYQHYQTSWIIDVTGY